MAIKVAVAYARFSSDNQRAESITAQLHDIREYAKREGYTIVAEYIDEAKSATTDKRPDFQRMIADAEQQTFDTVLVFKLDRFSRDRYDFAYYRRKLKRCGVKIVSINEPLSDDPESAILESVLEGMAEYYSRNLSREVMRKGLLPNAHKCIHNGGTPPLGYDVVDQHYIINENEAETVRIIFQMYADGEPCFAIISRLDAEGRKSKLGNRLLEPAFRDILRNEKYRGIYIYNRQAYKDADGKRIKRKCKDESEIIRIPDGMPRIISDELFFKAQRRMNAVTRKSNRRNREYILTGKIFCGGCEKPMIGASTQKNGVVYPYYKCSNGECSQKPIRADRIEKTVVESIYTDILSDAAKNAFADRVVAYMRSVKTESPKVISEYRRKLNDVEKAISGIVSAIENGMYSPTMNARMEDLETQKVTYAERIREEEKKSTVSQIDRDAVLEYIGSFGDIRTADPKEQKKAIDVFLDMIVINGTDADIYILSPNISHENGSGKPYPVPCEIMMILHRKIR